MARIIYVTVRNLDAPIGGVMVQAEHVAALHRAGFEAMLASDSQGGRPSWIAPDAPFCKSATLRIRPDDVLVLHDSLPRSSLDRYTGMPVRRVLFCQNHYFLDGTLAPHERYADFPIDAFLCVSEPIAAHLREIHHVAAPVIIRPFIEPGECPDMPERKLRICYMPRKRYAEAGSVIYRLRYLHGEVAGTPFVGIHRKHPDEVAAIMRESAIFLSLSGFEGLGLPPLEAMAAGCVVVGYHGGGGLDYATPQNGLWFDEAVPDNLASLLADTIRKFREDSTAFDDMVRAGRETAARYNRAGMEAALLDFWRSYL